MVQEPLVVAETPEAAITEHQPVGPRRPHPHEYPVANFSEDDLYELLVAEVAVYREDYEIALDTYVNIATLTRDPGVAARATMLAAYLRRDEVALSLAKIWTEEDPDDIDGHRFIADLLMRVGDLEGAITHMVEIKRLDGLANFEAFAIQVANLGDGDRSSLLAAISSMLEADSEDEQLLFSKAVLLEQKGDYEEALEIADRLLAERKNVNVIILKVNALRDQDRHAEVVTFLEEMLIDLPEIKRVRLIYARFLFETDDLDGSRAQYERVLKDDPSDGNVLFALALIALEQKDDVEAEQHLLEMVRWSRRVGEAHFYLGSIAERRNDLAQAIREYKQVSSRYEFLPAQSRIAAILIEQGGVTEARDHLARMRAEEPDRRDQIIMIEAQLLSERGLQDEVFDLLDVSVAADPNNIDLLYFRAMTGEKFGDLGIFERDLRTIITIQPGNADALNALGYTLTDRTNRHEEALALIERALAIKPMEAAFIDSLGWALYRLENFAEAVVHLRKALELFPNDEVAAHLGEVLWVMGEQLEASTVWQKALELAPESAVLKKIIQQFTRQ